MCESSRLSLLVSIMVPSMGTSIATFKLTCSFCSSMHQGLGSHFPLGALIALARSLCKCLLAVLITASGANAVKGYLVRCACIDDTIQ